MHPHFYGSHRQFLLTCDLLIFKSLVAAQNDELPLIGVQLAHGTFQLFKIIFSIAVMRDGGWIGPDGFLRGQGIGPLLLAEIEMCIPGYPVHP